jgi:hypothetical protein
MGNSPVFAQDRRLRRQGNLKATHASAGESLHHECAARKPAGIPTFTGGRDGNYLFELEAQPGGPEGRSLTTAGSQPIVVVERPRSVPAFRSCDFVVLMGTTLVILRGDTSSRTR